MVHRKRKKNTRQRGGTTYGWGSMKKHRGKGNKGGAGRSGTGKRAHSRKPSIWGTGYLGKYGFTSKIKNKVHAINIDDVERLASRWVSEGKATQESQSFKIDLSAIGYNKLLGKGVAKSKLMIKVDSATQKAIDKIAALGGKVTTE